MGCADSTDSEIDATDLNLDYDTADGPSLPAPPPDSTCALIQRGTLGSVQDSDFSYGNGNWAAGSYPFSWTGPSPYDHWSAYQFDLSVVPAGASITAAVFSTYVSWNADSATVRAHRILGAWNESTNWAGFTGNGASTNWDAAVLGSFDAGGWGWRSIDVTTAAQKWHGGQWANHGLLLEEDPVKLHNYFTSEASLSQRPNLWVCWSAGAPACGEPGDSCNALNPCCDGICNDGVCPGGGGGGEGGGGGGPVCANPGETCNALTPCCSGLCNDGVCPGGGGGGGGGGVGECGAIGSGCSADADCCGGSCFDGACIATDVCVAVDTYGACDPSNPCCDGGHCVVDTCFPLEDISTCATAGGSCDPDNGLWCCWGMQCNANGTCE
ncbi:MAG: DNRLRE domain-containing protein [Polyangiaceae bacterium]